MKNLIFIMLVLMVIPVKAQEIMVDSSFANGYYVKRMAAFEQELPKEHPYVFIGNSITEAGNWDELLPTYQIVNRGISGDNTFGVLARLDETLAINPTKLFLMIGVNDLKQGTPFSYIKKNHRRILEKLRNEATQVEVYIQSILPVRDPMLADFYSEITNKRIDFINRYLQEITIQLGFTYVDLNKEVFTDEDGLLYEKHTTDGLHLSQQGYQAWINYLISNGYL